jgi:hypothetical protein
LDSDGDGDAAGVSDDGDEIAVAGSEERGERRLEEEALLRVDVFRFAAVRAERVRVEAVDAAKEESAEAHREG